MAQNNGQRPNNPRRIPLGPGGLPDLGALARSQRHEKAVSGPVQPVVINLSITLPAATEKLGDQLRGVVQTLQAMADEGEARMAAINEERLREKMAGIKGIEDAWEHVRREKSLEGFTDAVRAVLRANGCEVSDT